MARSLQLPHIAIGLEIATVELKEIYMSISMDRFAAQGQFATYEPHPVLAARTAVFHLQCHSCGFEPDSEVVTPPRLCPKCHGESWERFARPGSILDNAIRSGPTRM